MSKSVEQQIKEVLAGLVEQARRHDDKRMIRAKVLSHTGTILSIIETEVIGEDERTLYEPEDGYDEWDASRNALRAEQRANLREEK